MPPPGAQPVPVAPIDQVQTGVPESGVEPGPVQDTSPGVPPAPAGGEPGLGAESEEPYFNPDELEVITVTVDRRERNLQDYPGSATAFTQDDLARVGIVSVRQMAAATPYVEIGTQESNTEIYIRGVGSNYNTELGDPAAATHIDGVYVPRPRGVGSMMFDMERVEINRGPQGTLRGRNATAGSINIVTAKPKLGEWGAGASVQIGNYSQRVTQAMVNIPIGDRLALRFATFSESRSPFYDNAGPIHTLQAAESADTLAYRASLQWLPVDKVRINLVHDYTQEGGTGFSGTNFFPALSSGVLPEEVPNPRAVLYRGPQGSQDLKHWGVLGDVQIDLGPVIIGYLGSYRYMKYDQTSSGNAGVMFPGRDMASVNLDDWSTSYWLTTSKSVVQELRLFAPDDSRFRWTVGGFFFNEEQYAFLGQNQDVSSAFAGVEYNMPDIHGHSYAGFFDMTFDIIETLRGTAGIRYTTENKTRDGIGNVYGFTGLTENFRYGTEGFKFARRDRTDYTTPGEEGRIGHFENGVKRYGVRDTLDEALQQPGVGMWGAMAEQHGEYTDQFVDFRVGLDYDVTPDNLVYVMFSTGHKSGGFNDNIDIAGVSVAKEYDPEALYATEIGSKNEFLDRRLIANVSAFWYAYQNQQFQTIQAIAQGDDDEDAANTSVRFNAANSRILGLEADITGRLPAGFSASAAVMLLHARFTEGSLADTRVGFDAATQPIVDIEGNTLPRAPNLALNYSLSQIIETPVGYFDWVVSAQTKTKQYMTVFNGEGRNPEGEVNPNLSDVVPGYTRLDAGIGYARPDGKSRIDAFVSNLTDRAYMTTLINTPNLNLRFFNPPRQFGVRLTLFL